MIEVLKADTQKAEEAFAADTYFRSADDALVGRVCRP